uniref:(northern house mosquito) hypothetical protein n=1 Tax=Culex pipiens TaxID=7175 RepID=A0A8D8GXM8_CULPI
MVDHTAATPARIFGISVRLNSALHSLNRIGWTDSSNGLVRTATLALTSSSGTVSAMYVSNWSLYCSYACWSCSASYPFSSFCSPYNLNASATLISFCFRM